MASLVEPLLIVSIDGEHKFLVNTMTVKLLETNWKIACRSNFL